MSDFKVGDRVRLQYEDASKSKYNGARGFVASEANHYGYIRVHWDAGSASDGRPLTVTVEDQRDLQGTGQGVDEASKVYTAALLATYRARAQRQAMSELAAAKTNEIKELVEKEEEAKKALHAALLEASKS